MKLTKLEAIRGFAAFYVVLHHTFLKLPWVQTHHLDVFLRFGQEAVILFFILSGFVIQYSFNLSKDKTFKSYFFKRFNRIFIPLIVVFLLNYILVLYQTGGNVSLDLKNLMLNIFMLQDIKALKPNVICNPFLGNSPLWSLSYEWWFYMAIYVIWKFFGKASSTFVYVIGVLAAISYLVYPFFINRLLMYLMVWNIGADMAKLYLNEAEISFYNLRYQIGVISLSVAILSLNVYLNLHRFHSMINFNDGLGVGVSPILELRHFSFALLCILAGVFWKKLNWIGFKYSFGVFEPLAKISYSLYISHWFMIANATYLDFISNSIIRYALYFTLCIIISYLIERILYVKLNRLIVQNFLTKKKMQEFNENANINIRY